MKIIAHRGLLEGPNKDTENSPEQIAKAQSLGFDVEIDIWMVGGEFYLGHDEPTYKTSIELLESRGVWVHCKNLEALEFLSRKQYINYFWHQNDDFTLTSHGFIWTYPGKKLTANSIEVLPEWGKFDQDWFGNYKKYKNIYTHYGVCTDYALKIGM